MNRMLERYDINVPEYACLTMAFSAANHGSLMFLTAAALEGGSLPDDDRVLAEIARCESTKWLADRRLYERFFDVSDGRWTHRRSYLRRATFAAEHGRLGFRQWRAIRARIFERDGFACVYCGAKAERLECDHVVPLSRGGSNDDANLATACKPCNGSKWAKTPSEWRGAE